MAILRSPDNRLRLDLALRARGREAEIGTPAVRVVFDKRMLLNWSPLLSVGTTGAVWRYADGYFRTMNRLDDPEDSVASEFIASFESVSTPKSIVQISVRCAVGGVACQFESGWGTHFRFPRETQGIVADSTRPSGFSKRPIGQALMRSPLPVTCLFAHGKCAVLSRNAASWLMLVGDSPVDLPANFARGLLAYEREGAHGADIVGAVTTSPADSAAFNCFVPFVISPALLDPQPMLWAQPGLEGVTDAHGIALKRVRESDWSYDEVRWVRGEIGEYLLIARRTGRVWRLAALTVKARAWTVWLPFLEPSVSYHAVWYHDLQPDRPCFLPLPEVMDAESRPLIQLAAAGGFTLDLVPLESSKEI